MMEVLCLFVGFSFGVALCWVLSLCRKSARIPSAFDRQSRPLRSEAEPFEAGVGWVWNVRCKGCGVDFVPVDGNGEPVPYIEYCEECWAKVERSE